MGSRGSSSKITPASGGSSGGTLTPAQSEAVKMAKDYAAEVLTEFNLEFGATYDDRAYKDPYFDVDEYEEEMENIIRRARQMVGQFNTMAEQKSYVAWSTEYEQVNRLGARAISELADEYETLYRRQKLDAGR